MIVKLLVLHFIADFVLQPREMGVKKSSDLRWLGGHLAIQFLIFAPLTSILFALANCAIHGVIDWFIWRGYKWTVVKCIYKDSEGRDCHSLISDTDYSFVPPRLGEWRFWLDHLFYITIGLDQMLHGITLVLLAGWML